MAIAKIYESISFYFDTWSRIMEIRTRIAEVGDSRIGSSRILIISPPTDRGIELLARANTGGAFRITSCRLLQPVHPRSGLSLSQQRL